MKQMRCVASALLFGCVSIAASGGALEPKSRKAPGILTAGPRSRPNSVKILGFSFARSGIFLNRNCPAKCSPAITRPVRYNAQGVRSLSLSHLVTYGDIWRNALDESHPHLNFENRIVTQHQGVTITGLSDEFEIVNPRNIESVVRPVARAANVVGAAAAGAAANIWTSLTKGPSEDEMQENLRRWARSHGGAVLPPLEEGELESEVRFVGIFPELVESMVDAEIASMVDAEIADRERPSPPAADNSR